MKIIYVVPGIMDKEEMERRGRLLQEWAFPGVETAITGVTEGPASVESMYEEYLSIPATADRIYQLEQEGYDAAILGCAGDPGLDGIREITSDMLVVGPGQTSMQVAAMLGNRFSLLTVTESTVASSYELAHKAGVTPKLASVEPLASDREATITKIVEIGQGVIKRDRADTLVLGCMTMGFLDVAEEIQQQLGVPVVNPSKVGLKMAEALVGSGLMHSKKAFMLPPKLETGKVNSLAELYVEEE
ncbi:MAG: aspartate/glutamate racemase family protein [Bacillota bacterium]